MDEKEKKKESIDEILADLNGLLNKMPDILEGIKLPEIKPADLRSVWKDEPALPTPVRAEDVPDKIVNPGESPASAEPDSPALRPQPQAEPMAYSVEPAGLDAAPLLPEIKPVSEEIKPGEQADPAEGEKSPPADPVPADAPTAAPPLPSGDAVPDFYTPQKADEIPPDGPALKSQVSEVEEPLYDLDSLKEEEAAIENAFKLEPEKEEEGKPAAQFEGTRDFGVPDIDALIKLSQEEALPNGLAEDRGERVEEPEKQAELSPAIEQAAEPALEPGLEPEAAVPVPDLENIAIAPVGAGEEGGVMDLKKDDSVNEENSKPPLDAAENTLSEAENAVGTEAEQPSPQLVIEQANSVFNSDNVPAPGGDDKTVVIPPSTGPEQDKTVIYEAGTDPGTTSRRAADLDSLAAKPVPEGIPPERVRTVAFLYAADDAALCAGMLAELDAICLKSSAKPMFIKRAFVQVCEPGNSGNVVMQKVADSAACGLVCLGDLPQENVFEIENVFTAGGVFFRHFPRESFNHSAALDLVTEFILK